MEEGKRKAFCEDLQGIEENLASLLIDSWFRSDLDEFVVPLNSQQLDRFADQDLWF